MKIVVTHSSGFDYEAELYGPLRASSLMLQHSILLPHEPQNRNVSTKVQLLDAHLVVAEVSYPSTGQGIELGWADMMNVPILMLHRTEMRPSRSLSFLNGSLVAYNGPEDLLRRVQKRVGEMLMSAHAVRL